MGRRLKIGIGVALALLALLVVNALLVDGETKNAGVTVAGGRILDLPNGEIQVIDRGPRQAPPIVLIHCYTCSLNWWDRVIPLLEGGHRVIAMDLLGHGGSEKPSAGYTPESQASVVAEALERLEVTEATVVGHSLGGSVGVALAEQSPQLVDRLAIVDMPPDNSYGDLGFIAGLGFQPVLGEALWKIKPDFSIRDGISVAFAPDFDVPDTFVEDVKRMTYSAYEGSHEGFDQYTGEAPLSQRAAALKKPVLAIMGAEEQLADDPESALAAYRDAAPWIQTKLIAGAGHSPNVEKPAQTAALALQFDVPVAEKQGSARQRMQDGVQDRDRVRPQS